MPAKGDFSGRYPISLDGKCTVSGCERPERQCGYCGMHYKRVLKTGDAGPAGALPRKGLAPPPKACDVEGCDRATRSHKAMYCDMHRRRAALGAEMTPDKLKVRNTGNCSVEGCDRQAKTKQLCKGHYSRLLRGGHPGDARFFEPKMEPFIRDDGYRMVRVGAGRYELEHRVVMERMIGRKLAAGETPHHKNGQRADNRESNLELWSTAQPAGQRVTDKIAWCAEMVRQYPEIAKEFGLHHEEEFRPSINKHSADEYLRFVSMN